MELVVTHPLVDILRNAMSIFVYIVSHAGHHSAADNAMVIAVLRQCKAVVQVRHSLIALIWKMEVNLIHLDKYLCPALSASFQLVRRFVWVARVFVGGVHGLGWLLVKILPIFEVNQQLLPGAVD